MQEEIKLGPKTSEFWITLAPILASMVDGVNQNSEDKKYLMICACVLGSLYICSRTIIKVSHGRRASREELQDIDQESL